MSAVSFVSHQSATQVHESLVRSLTALDDAHQCSVLWFGDGMQRRLYRDLGYSSINQYAMRELGFSKSRTRDFVRLAAQLEQLPAVREAVATGELGYAKAREILPVATPNNETRWLEAAKQPRRELVRAVKQARQAARVDPGQGELMPSEPTVVAPQELPVDYRIRLTPEQEARRAALIEKLHKLGDVPRDRAELLLEALAALVEAHDQKRGPRGPFPPPVRMTVQTDSGERELSRADSERMRCDAAVCARGGRNTTTIPPRTRREVLARDRHRCRAPGCDRTGFLEVHHLTPRNRGGTNHSVNLITLCASCHRLCHTYNSNWPPRR